MSKITLSMLMLFPFFCVAFSHGQTTTAALFVTCENGMHQPARQFEHNLRWTARCQLSSLDLTCRDLVTVTQLS